MEIIQNQSTIRPNLIFKDNSLLDVNKNIEEITVTDDLGKSHKEYTYTTYRFAPGECENEIVALIRTKYSLNDELAILRQRDIKVDEYAEFNAYVEECKTKINN